MGSNIIDIIIVNWNSGSQLRTCVRSIDRYGSGLVKKTIVVDNGSVDGSDDCADDAPDINIVRTGINLGFGKACNLGAQQAMSDYLLFLNPDAFLYKDTLPKALGYMEDPSNAAVGICGVQLLDESGQVSRSCARFPSQWHFMAHALGIDRYFPRLGYRMGEWDHGETRRVDHVIGAFFLVRRKLFEAMGGFDERFFVYLEDLDFSYRAYQSGWSTTYLADTRAYHAGGGTSNQIKARRLFYSLRSRLVYVSKHFSRAEAVAVYLATLLVEPFSRLAWAGITFSLSGLMETWNGYGLLWRWWLAKHAR